MRTDQQQQSLLSVQPLDSSGTLSADSLNVDQSNLDSLRRQFCLAFCGATVCSLNAVVQLPTNIAWIASNLFCCIPAWGFANQNDDCFPCAYIALPYEMKAINDHKNQCNAYLPIASTYFFCEDMERINAEIEHQKAVIDQKKTALNSMA